MVMIAPSILSADFSNLEREVKALELAGADMIHIDVMDGHFVPNLSFGPLVINALRKHTKLPFDVHLMIKEPEHFIYDYVKAGSDIITIHHEATLHIDKTLDTIKNLGIKAGISLIPSTPPGVVDYIIDRLDLILVMTVNPGFAGQSFIESQLDKIKTLSEKIKKSDKKIMLSVDGGINEREAKACINAGSDILVSGSFIFQGASYKEQITKLRDYPG
jgi:ribulose-phosphate 3-epimerase